MAPRDSGLSPQPSPKATVVETLVAANGRLRLTGEIVSTVDWLRNAPLGVPLEAVMRIGADRQLILTPAAPAEMTEFQAKLRETETTISEKQLLDFARVAASVWSVTLSAEHRTKRRELILPRGARLLKIAPDVGEGAIIFALGAQIEIWRSELWVAFVSDWEKQREQNLAALSDLLGE